MKINKNYFGRLKMTIFFPAGLLFIEWTDVECPDVE